MGGFGRESLEGDLGRARGAEVVEGDGRSFATMAGGGERDRGENRGDERVRGTIARFNLVSRSCSQGFTCRSVR